MTRIVGLTGGIASGKSLISQYLIDQDVPLIDADLVSRQVVEKGTAGLKALVETFGQDILEKDGQLDRKKLGRLVFADASQRQKLNDILHPLIRQEIESQIEEQLKASPSLIVLDIALLFEAGFDDLADDIWLVKVDPLTQKQRLMARDGLSGSEADQRIRSQLPLLEKEKRADLIIDNNGSRQETYRQVVRLLQDI